MRDWRGRGRRSGWTRPAPVERRRWSWKIDGIDVRPALLFILPLGVLCGALLARDGGAVPPQPSSAIVQDGGPTVSVTRGGSGTTAAAPSSSAITGTASVIDGDTIEIRGIRIRLDGIDAPEGRQTCQRGGVAERCGQTASFYLSDMIGRRPVSCEPVGTDRYGRTLGICYEGGRDLNAEMVRAGHAVAYRQYSRRYVGVEDEARWARRGMWSTEFVMPWDFRRR